VPVDHVEAFNGVDAALRAIFAAQVDPVVARAVVPVWFQLTAIQAAYDDPRGRATSWESARMPRWTRRALAAVGIRNQQAAGSNPAPGSSLYGYL
jgi:hypothetical protein